MRLEDFGIMSEADYMSSYGYLGVKMVQNALPFREEDSGDTKYEQWHDGTLIRTYKGKKAKVQIPTVIRKTVKNGSVIERYHGVGFWDDRASINYQPICHAIPFIAIKMIEQKFIKFIEEKKD